MKDKIKLSLLIMLVSFICSGLIVGMVESEKYFWPGFLILGCLIFVCLMVVAVLISYAWAFVWGDKWE